MYTSYADDTKNAHTHTHSTYVLHVVYSLGFSATVSAARCLVVLPLLHLLLAVVLLHVGKIK